MATPEAQYARLLAERWIAQDAPDEGEVEARARRRAAAAASLRSPRAAAATVACSQFAHHWRRYRANRAVDFQVRPRSRAAGREMRPSIVRVAHLSANVV